MNLPSDVMPVPRSFYGSICFRITPRTCMLQFGIRGFTCSNYLSAYTVTDAEGCFLLRVLKQHAKLNDGSSVLSIGDETLFGLVECDTHLPDNKKRHSEETAPIIKNTDVTRCHEMPRDVTRYHGISRKITRYHESKRLGFHDGLRGGKQAVQMLAATSHRQL